MTETPKKQLSNGKKAIGIAAIIILVLGIIAGAYLLQPSHIQPAIRGVNFDNIVIIAMENQNYGSVIGSSSAPFINSLAAQGTTISNYHSYGQGISGCSAGCYQAFTAGQVVGSDSWCPRASSPCSAGNVPTIISQLTSAGLSSALFCEDGCPRGSDHFPFIGYPSTWNTCVTGTFSCNG